MQPIVICEANRAEIDAICKAIRGWRHVLRSYKHLTEVIQTLEKQFKAFKLNIDDFIITYTSGDEVSERYGYPRWATEVDLNCEQGVWTILDIRSTKIPYVPINYRWMPKTAIEGTASL